VKYLSWHFQQAIKWKWHWSCENIGYYLIVIEMKLNRASVARHYQYGYNQKLRKSNSPSISTLN